MKYGMWTFACEACESRVELCVQPLPAVEPSLLCVRCKRYMKRESHGVGVLAAADAGSPCDGAAEGG